MSHSKGETITVQCGDCGKEIQVSLRYYKEVSHKENNHTWRCVECRNKHFSKCTKSYLDNLSPEEKARRSELGRNLHKKWLESLSEEEKKRYSESLSNGQRKRWAKQSPEEKAENVKYLRDGLEKWKNTAPPEEIQAAIDKAIQGKLNMSQEAKDAMLDKRSKSLKESWSKVPDDERKRRMARQHEGSRNWWKRMTPERRKEFLDTLHANAKRYRDSLSPEEKAYKMNQTIRKSKSRMDNRLCKQFEYLFSTLPELSKYYYESEFYLGDDMFYHHWDYAVFDENCNLVMVVDLDGPFAHGDLYDYNGYQSHQHLDERRSLTVPEGVHHMIVPAIVMNECLTEMIQKLSMTYDQYVEKTFNIFRSQPFPEPHYLSNNVLLNSFIYLQRLNCDDKYHQSLSLNSRNGDILIQHFHTSIWLDKCKGCLSPYEAWQDDDILKRCINNRIIAQSHFNKNKILQGMALLAEGHPVSVFSAGRAKMIIHRYLSEFDTIFDPFSGYSGRMLGAISLGKRYIGQDLSPSHVIESNRMMEFLRSKGIAFDATVTQRDILDSSGEYQCLFTCQPYSDKEQWVGVPVDTRSCDDWIDECLRRFKCERYVFVVDSTEKYADKVVDVIENREFLGKYKESVVVINNDSI